LSLGEAATARGAGLLFGTNVVAIILGAAVNFFLAGIRGKKASGVWARRLVIVLALVCAGLTVPLTSILVGKVTTPRVMEQSLGAVAAEAGYRLLKLRKLTESGEEVMELDLAGPEPPGQDLLE